MAQDSAFRNFSSALECIATPARPPAPSRRVVRAGRALIPILVLLVTSQLACVATAFARDWLVPVQDSVRLQEAIRSARPGDSILLANGEWRDLDIKLETNGSARKPITLRSETPGGVIIAGRSTLRTAGRHLIVRDLVFRSGHPLDGAVIVTRIGNRWTENLRLTKIVVDGFSNADRRMEDHWIVIHGRNIRVDHSHFEGKQNVGAMFVVVREKQWPLDNRVRIDHNYFGPRPLLGSNGGETIRIGTSDESLSSSLSVIEDNIFERCDGEVEIVSIKSGGNIVRRNLFLRSQGALVLRHGNGNLVEANVFLGEGLPNTGGIRVINRNQTVRGNYLEGLTGSGFSSALTVMNGVPNSPINRYHQVRGASISNNSVIESSAVILGAGASAERSLAPRDVRMFRNLVWSNSPAPVVRVDASTSGISSRDNVVNVEVPEAAGFRRQEFALDRAANGLLYPTDPALAAIGAPRTLARISRPAVGVDWYPGPKAQAHARATGTTIRVDSAAGLAAAIDQATDGDIIDLESSEIELASPLLIRHSVTVSGAGARLTFRGETLFQILEGGSLRLRGLTISGARAPARSGNAVIRTQSRSMLKNYIVDITNCRFSDLAVGPAFDLIATTPGTFAAQVRIADSDIADVSGAAFAGAAERGNVGLYPAEELIFDNVRFTRVATVVDLLRGGTDESTFGPRFNLTGSTLVDSGAVQLSGVQFTRISSNRFVRSAGVSVAHSAGEPNTEISDNVFEATPAPAIVELLYRGPARAVIRENRLQ